MKFEDYNWHDSIIKLINIDRTTPGIKDVIIFEIENLDGNKDLLEFEDVYWANINLNWGIVSEDSILIASVLDENNSDLIDFYLRWKGLMNDVDLRTYLIELNSTGSLIKIIAKNFKISPIL